MKLLLLLGFVALASAAYEPKAGDKRCKICGEPLVRTFDAHYMSFSEVNKTMMAKSLDNEALCKIEIDCVTSADYYFDPEAGPAVYVDWCSIGFWPAKNVLKPQGDWVFGQSLLYIGERGSSMKGMEGRTVPREWPMNMDNWHKKVTRPQPSGCKPFSVTCCPDDTGASQHADDGLCFRSNPDCEDCRWAVDWWPAGRHTCIDIWALDGNPHIASPGNPGTMIGMCQNMNNDDTDDYYKCGFPGEQGTPGASGWGEIARTCSAVVGDHPGTSGARFAGGTRLHKHDKTQQPSTCP